MTERTPLIGRHDAQEACRAALLEGPCLWLHGSPGVGKTRLLQALHQELNATHSWVWCDLSHDASRSALGALKQALGLPLTCQDEVMHEALRRGEVQVIIWDHVADPARELSPILELCQRLPRLRVVFTSTMELAAPHVLCVALRGLSGAQGEALYLKSLKPMAAGMWAEDELESLRELVEGLQGSPRAIELAAAQAPLLPPSELVPRLDARFEWLRSEPAHPGVLEIGLRRAWHKLGPQEQRALCRLSACVQAFDLAMALAMLDELGEDATRRATSIQLLQTLMHHHVLLPDPCAHAQASFLLDANWRAFVRLHMSDQAHREASALHARQISSRLDAIVEGAWTPWAFDSAQRLEQIEPMLPSIRRAALDATDLEVIGRCASALALHARHRTSRRQALAELAHLTLPERSTSAMHGMLQLVQLDLLMQLDESVRASHLLARLEPLFGQNAASHDPLWCISYGVLRALHRDEEHGGETISALQEALALAKSSRSKPALITVMIAMARVLMAREQTIPALSIVERALSTAHSMSQTLEFQDATLHSLHASLLRAMGVLDQAQTQLECALKMYRKLGSRRLMAHTLNELGMIYHMQRDYDQASSSYRDGIQLGAVNSTSWSYQHKALKGDFGLLKMNMGELRHARELITQTAHLVDIEHPFDEPLKFQMLLGVLLYRSDRATSSRYCFAQMRSSEAFALLSPLKRARYELLIEAFQDFNARALGEQDDDRIDMSAIKALSSSPQIDGWMLMLCQECIQEHERLGGKLASTHRLSVGEGGKWFRIDDQEVVDMTRRGPMRRILRGLVAHHRHHPADPIHAVDLFMMGWPEHNGVIPETGLHRLYSTMNRIRHLGFEKILHTDEEGYYLDGSLEVTIST